MADTADTPKRARDSQRSKVYAAQHCLADGPQGWSVAEMQKRVDHLTDSAWFARRWPLLHRSGILVLDGRGRSSACATVAYDNTRGTYVPAIKMPLWSRQNYVLAHEVAHHCADETYGYVGVAAHGWQFAGTFLELVHHIMGKGAGDTLKRSFREHKVRFREPRKRNLTEAQREAARERLALARAARAVKG